MCASSVCRTMGRRLTRLKRSRGVRVEGMRHGGFDVESFGDPDDRWSVWTLSRSGGGVRVLFRARMRLRDDQFLEEVRRGAIGFSRGASVVLEYHFHGRQVTDSRLLSIVARDVTEYRPASGPVWVPARALS